MLVILDSGGVEVGDHMDRYLKTREAVGSGVTRRGLLWVCGYYADVTHPPSIALNVVSIQNRFAAIAAALIRS